MFFNILSFAIKTFSSVAVACSIMLKSATDLLAFRSKPDLRVGKLITQRNLLYTPIPLE